MAEWEGDKICGVGGRSVTEFFLVFQSDYATGTIALRPLEEKKARALGMDCSSSHFYHANLGPANIVVDAESIGIADWYVAGCFPRGWIRTKIVITPGTVLPEGRRRRCALV